MHGVPGARFLLGRLARLRRYRLHCHAPAPSASRRPGGIHAPRGSCSPSLLLTRRGRRAARHRRPDGPHDRPRAPDDPGDAGRHRAARSAPRARPHETAGVLRAACRTGLTRAPTAPVRRWCDPCRSLREARCGRGVGARRGEPSGLASTVASLVPLMPRGPRGVTLVELLVAIALLTLLTARRPPRLLALGRQSMAVAVAGARCRRGTHRDAAGPVRIAGARAPTRPAPTCCAWRRTPSSFRAMRGFGVTCAVSAAQVRVRDDAPLAFNALRAVAPGRDSLLLFVEGDTASRLDDRWVRLAGALGGRLVLRGRSRPRLRDGRTLAALLASRDARRRGGRWSGPHLRGRPARRVHLGRPALARICLGQRRRSNPAGGRARSPERPHAGVPGQRRRATSTPAAVRSIRVDAGRATERSVPRAGGAVARRRSSVEPLLPGCSSAMRPGDRCRSPAGSAVKRASGCSWSWWSSPPGGADARRVRGRPARVSQCLRPGLRGAGLRGGGGGAGGGGVSGGWVGVRVHRSSCQQIGPSGRQATGPALPRPASASMSRSSFSPRSVSGSMGRAGARPPVLGLVGKLIPAAGRPGRGSCRCGRAWIQLYWLGGAPNRPTRALTPS